MARRKRKRGSDADAIAWLLLLGIPAAGPVTWALT